jgi:polynucleotide 5'-kinase involved in rRNA processing
MVKKNAGSPVALTEKILDKCYNIYSEKENGLCDIAKSMGSELLEPRKKITVMLIGNHSAGKSSFINWYIEEHIQKTGVAIETQG